jgi:hypothetical protein
MGRFPRPNLLSAVTGVLFLGVVVTWVLYGLFGHSLIQTLYTSEWLPGTIMSERATIPLAAYYQKADEMILVWLLRFILFWSILFVFMIRPAPALLFFFITLAVYGASTARIGLFGQAVQSDQLHYSYLAESFLNGRLNIVLTSDEANVMSEVVVYREKCYVLFPPMPAILLLPAVALFGKTFPTILLSMGLAAISVALMYTLLRRAGFSKSRSIWVTVLFGFGTTFWYTSVDGSVWWLGQITGVFFLLIALVEAYGKKRPILIGLMIGAGSLARLPLVLSTPFFLYLLLKEKEQRIQKVCLMLCGVSTFVGLNMLYNWVRFGATSNIAYYMIPEVALAPWYTGEVFNLSYIPRNIYAMFFQPPELIHDFPYIIPSKWGLSLFFTTPALFLMFNAPADRLTCVLAGAAFLVSLPSLLHGFPGAAQFGYRFSLDYTPFLMLLTARAIGSNFSKRARLLIILSCAISLWGLRYATWIEPKWLFDIGAYYKNVHPDEAKINSICVGQEDWEPLLRKVRRHLRETFAADVG